MANDPNTFTCALCKETFEMQRSDEEAWEEYAQNFPDLPAAITATEIICDDCYKKVMGDD